MKLELSSYNVKEAQFSSLSGLSHGVLNINKAELETLLARDDRLKKFRVELALPGERTRIVHVLDVIEPRWKVEGSGAVFPGFLGPPTTVGEGRTNRLAGAAVVTATELPREERGLFFARERVIDMGGPGAAYSPFSKTVNLVLGFEPKQGISLEDYDEAIRMAGLKAASYLAELTRDHQPDGIQSFELTKVDPALPKMVYIYQITSSGILANNYIYGEAAGRFLPTIIHPNEIMDGALVSGCYIEGHIPTYIHCNNPAIAELYRLHGKDFNFAGVVLMYGGGLNATNSAKLRAASYAAKLAKFLEADMVILTQQGGGNSIVDQMLTCRACEQPGIKTAVVTYEMGGAEGVDYPLIFVLPEADAMASTGNREEKVLLPAMDKVIGGEKTLLTGQYAKGPLELYTSQMASAVDQAGFGKVTAKAY